MSSGLVRCQRIGCDCFYDPSSSSSSSSSSKKKCVYHSKPPTFRDGEKLWPCCNKRSKDFNAFLSIEGCCEADEHTQEKPPQPQKQHSGGVVFRSSDKGGFPQREAAAAKHPFDEDDDASKKKCPRCSNGFKCEDHPEESRKNEEKERMRREERKRIKKKEEEERMNADPNAEQTCTRAGCGMKFRESENTDTACRYHSGKPIFHERSKGWSCCASGKKAVYDFDEFLKIKTCKIGRHSSIAVEEEE